jgi:putative membrane protein
MRASWLVTIPLAALLVLFAVSNTEVVRLKLWPFDHTADLPLSVAVLGVAAVAFLFGAFVVWTAALPVRLRARRLESTTAALRAEVDELRRALARTPAAEKPSPALARR